MNYIVRNIKTNEVFFSKGANKIAELVGCDPSNITKYFKNVNNFRKDKVFKDWIISKCTLLEYKNRGNNTKFRI